jgi:hypothetical protein
LYKFLIKCNDLRSPHVARRFAKKTFGPTWKLVQTRVRPPPKRKAYEDYLFQDDEEDQAAANSSDED